MSLVYFRCPDEILVTTPEGEADLVKDFFLEGGRDLDDYDREEVDEPLAISLRFNIS